MQEMNTDQGAKTRPFAAVVGAAGHTGQFVVRELLRRGISPIAIVRNADALGGTSLLQRKCLCREAALDNAEQLACALEGAGAVINCAGPFLDTADPVAAAAVRSRMHYLDLSAEQDCTRRLFDRYDVLAAEANISVLPSMAFYGGFADLLATAALREWQSVDTLDVVYGLDSWHPTRGTRRTGAKSTAPREMVAAGKMVAVPSPRPEIAWDFGDPLHQQRVIVSPASEVTLITRHVKTNELRTWLTRVAFDDIRNPNTPEPTPVDEMGRSAQRFIVEVVAKHQGIERRVRAQGQDIYAFSAILVGEAVQRLLRDDWHNPGAQPPGVVFDSGSFLNELRLESLSFE